MFRQSYDKNRVHNTVNELTLIFNKQFNVQPNTDDVEWIVFAFAPGRINFIGEHVDYMNGWVCPAAVTDGTHILVGRVKHLIDEKKPKLRFYSTVFNDFFEMDSIDSNETNKEGGKNKSWVTFVRGAITLHLKQLGIEINDPLLHGVCMVIHGTLAMGVGMSSSAALSIALLNAIHSCVTQAYKHITPHTPSDSYVLIIKPPTEYLLQLAKQGRQIETDFCGVNIGIMDQCVSLLADENMFVFLDCKDLSFSLYSLEPIVGPNNEYSYIIIDSMIKHELSGASANAYNTLRSDQENAQKKITQHIFGGKKVFTFTDWIRNPEEFEGKHTEWKVLMEKARPYLSASEYDRGCYQLTEQLRTLEFKKILNVEESPNLSHQERLRKVGDILNEAQEGMKTLLRNTTPEIDFIHEIIKNDKDVMGGRMMGAGFGGCIIVILKHSAQDRVLKNVQEKFKQRFAIDNTAYKLDRIGGGAFTVSLTGLNSSEKP